MVIEHFRSGRRVAEVSEYQLAPTASRSVVGIMNEFAHVAETDRVSKPRARPAGVVPSSRGDSVRPIASQTRKSGPRVGGVRGEESRRLALEFIRVTRGGFEHALIGSRANGHDKGAMTRDDVVILATSTPHETYLKRCAASPSGTRAAPVVRHRGRRPDSPPANLMVDDRVSEVRTHGRERRQIRSQPARTSSAAPEPAVARVDRRA